MTEEPGLRLCIGADAPRAPGFLALDLRPDADAPIRAPDDLPFPDRSADVIACGEAAAGSSGAALAGLLLECRRVLRPQGVIRIFAPKRPRQAPASAGARSAALAVEALAANARAHVPNAEAASTTDPDVPRLAALVGLEATDRAPVAPHCAAALAALPPVDDRLAAYMFTKRDRQVTGEPLVSVLIPAYSPRFFAACLDSALAQTYGNIEIVVGDDSPDAAIEDIVRARSERRPIRYHRNPLRLGVRANHRRCFENARGEFVKFLCDDDLLAPTCVARLLDGFRRAPDVTLATSHRQLIDAEGRPHADQPQTLPIVERDALIAGHTLVNAMLMAGINAIGEPSTTLFRKADLLDQAPEIFRFNGVEGHGVIDMVMWSALMLKGDAVYLRDSLSFFRIHPGQRQRDPAKRQRNTDSIGSLRSAWLALGLRERIAPGQLLAKPLPPPAGGDDAARAATSPPVSPFVSAVWKATMKTSAGSG